MATIVAAMTTTAVFSVMLSGFTSQSKADKREASAMVLKRAQETLKSYVSATPGDVNYSPVGPAGAGVWAADNTGAWALSDGIHTITPLLAGTVLETGGTLTYTVTSLNCGFTSTTANLEAACKKVDFKLIYPDN